MLRRAPVLSLSVAAIACRTVVPDPPRADPRPPSAANEPSEVRWPSEGFVARAETRCTITPPPPAESFASWPEVYARVGKTFSFEPKPPRNTGAHACGGTECEAGTPVPVVAGDDPDFPAIDAGAFARPHAGNIELWPDLLPGAREYHCSLSLEGATESHGDLRVARLVRLQQTVVTQDETGRTCEVEEDGGCMMGCFYSARIELMFVYDLARDRGVFVEIMSPLELATEDPGPVTQVAWDEPGVPMRGCDAGVVKLLP
jgi:hypothetical protein